MLHQQAYTIRVVVFACGNPTHNALPYNRLYVGKKPNPTFANLYIFFWNWLLFGICSSFFFCGCSGFLVFKYLRTHFGTLPTSWRNSRRLESRCKNLVYRDEANRSIYAKKKNRINIKQRQFRCFTAGHTMAFEFCAFYR